MQLSGPLDPGSTTLTARKQAPFGRDGACGQGSGEGVAGGEFAKFLDGQHRHGARIEAGREERPGGSAASEAEQPPAREATPERTGSGIAASGETRVSAPAEPPAARIEAAIAGRAAQQGAGRGANFRTVEAQPAGTDRADPRLRGGHGVRGAAGAAGAAAEARLTLAAPNGAGEGPAAVNDGIRPSVLHPGGGGPSGRQAISPPPAAQAAAQAAAGARGEAGSGTSGASAVQDSLFHGGSRPGFDTAAQAAFLRNAASALPAGVAHGPSPPTDGRPDDLLKMPGAQVSVATTPRGGRGGDSPLPNELQLPRIRPGPAIGSGDSIRLFRGDAPSGVATMSGEGSGVGSIGAPAVVPVHSAQPQMSAAVQAAGSSEFARAVTSQIAGPMAAETAPGRFEVRLDPPELGRLEISLEIVEQSLRATVSAERPGTQDLVRRHADLLLAQLHQAGFSGVDLRFGGGDQRGFGGADAEAGAMRPASDAESGEDAATGAPEPVAWSGGTGGLDLRF